ncbi:MAG: hypothetical protein IPJ97_02295 [Proteobacteria bacterium]|nr:hypothetical protein [Pseudomonadota bacterium]
MTGTTVALEATSGNGASGSATLATSPRAKRAPCGCTSTFDLERARHAVRGCADARHLAGEGTARERIERHLCGRTRFHAHHVAVGEADAHDPARIRRAHHDHRLAGLHQFAALDHAFEHDAVHRRLDAGEARVEAHGVEVGARQVVRGGQVLHLFFRRDFVEAQLPGALQVPARLFDAFGRLRHRGIHFGALQFGEHLALAHDVTRLDAHRIDDAADLEGKADFVARCEHTHRACLRSHGNAGHRDRTHRGGLRINGVVLLFGAAGAKQGRHGHDGERLPGWHLHIRS